MWWLNHLKKDLYQPRPLFRSCQPGKVLLGLGSKEEVSPGVVVYSLVFDLLHHQADQPSGSYPGCSYRSITTASFGSGYMRDNRIRG